MFIVVKRPSIRKDKLLMLSIILFSDFGANINYQVLPLGLSFNQLLNGSLSIASVTKATEGMYTCTAQNGVRTGISKTINVTVNGKQKQPPLTTKHINKLQTVSKKWRSRRDGKHLC